MSTERDPAHESEGGAPGGRRETAESQGQMPTAEGAPLVTEEGIDEGVADLVEQGREEEDEHPPA